MTVRRRTLSKSCRSRTVLHAISRSCHSCVRTDRVLVLSQREPGAIVTIAKWRSVWQLSFQFDSAVPASASVPARAYTLQGLGFLILLVGALYGRIYLIRPRCVPLCNALPKHHAVGCRDSERAPPVTVISMPMGDRTRDHRNFQFGVVSARH